MTRGFSIVHPLVGHVFRDPRTVYLTLLFPLGYFNAFPPESPDSPKVYATLTLNFGQVYFSVPIDDYPHEQSFLLSLPEINPGAYILHACVVSNNGFFDGPSATSFVVTPGIAKSNPRQEARTAALLASVSGPFPAEQGSSPHPGQGAWILHGTGESSSIAFELADISLSDGATVDVSVGTPDAFATEPDDRPGDRPGHPTQSNVWVPGHPATLLSMSAWFCGCSLPADSRSDLWLHYADRAFAAAGGGGGFNQMDDQGGDRGADAQMCNCGCGAPILKADLYHVCVGFPCRNDLKQWRPLVIRGARWSTNRSSSLSSNWPSLDDTEEWRQLVKREARGAVTRTPPSPGRQLCGVLCRV